MKTFEVAEMVELSIAETAYGKNERANEANANKHPNKGAGKTNTIITIIDEVIPTTPDGDETDFLS